MEINTVEVTRHEVGISVVTLNRPDSLNAITPTMVDRLRAVFDEFAHDGVTRVVILTGAGRGFCSGHGLDDLLHDVGTASSPQSQLASQRAFSRLITQLNEFPLPLIAAVNGPAAGAGLALALAADTRVCSKSARFNAAFIRVGISGCDVGVSYLLPRIVGPTLAFEMMLTGRLIDADEALASRLVLRVVEDEAVISAAVEVARAILANSPFAVSMTKRAMWHGLDAPSLRYAMELEDRTQVLCLQTGDTLRAVPALFDKSQVDWASEPEGST